VATFSARRLRLSVHTDRDEVGHLASSTAWTITLFVDCGVTKKPNNNEDHSVGEIPTLRKIQIPSKVLNTRYLAEFTKTSSIRTVVSVQFTWESNRIQNFSGLNVF